MARYIDADKIEPHEQLESFGNGRYEYVRIAYMDDIDAIPSADVRENARGEWIHYDGEFDYDFKCSECGYSVWDNSDFCPNCGADMRGEENNG